MNTKFLLKGLSLLAVGALITGCSSDEIAPDTLKTVDRDSRFYINVSIASPDANSTRADDDISYSNGTEDERDIKKVLFVFYDAFNNYVTSAVISNGVDFDGKDLTTNTTYASSIEANLNIVLPVDVQEGQGVPQYVMAYVNPTSGIKDDGEIDNSVVKNELSNVLKLGRSLEQVIPFSSTDKEKYKSGATDYLGKTLSTHSGFTMTNSVYYESEHNLPNIAAELPADALYETEDKAKDENATRLVIYVERVVAKVNASFSDNWSQSGNDVVDSENSSDTYTLKFTPLAWGVNNVEKGTFLIKNFRTDTNYDLTKSNSSITLTNSTYNSVDSDWESTSSVWNYPDHYRSFWAYSPTYFGGSYPEFSDEYKDSESSYQLCYKSLNDFYDTTKTEDSDPYGPYGSALGNHLYTLEQTTQSTTIANAGETAIASVTIVGKYNIYKNNSTTPEPEGNFYLIRADKKLYASDQKMTEAFLAKNDVIYIKNESTDGYSLLNSSDYTSCKDYFEIIHPSKDITGVYTSSRYVSLQINKAGAKTGKYYYKNIYDEYVLVTESNVDDANSYLYSCIAAHFNAVEIFNNGWAYFSEPIKHIGADASTDVSNASTGQYGVVRNHVYTINVTGITGIGLGISDPDDPIIIPVKKKEYYVKTEINVQRWRDVGTQDVNLTPR